MQKVQTQAHAREGRQQDEKEKDRNKDECDYGLVFGEVIDQMNRSHAHHQHRVRAGEPTVFFPSAADVVDERVSKAGARVAKDPFDEAVDHLGEGDGENQVEGVVIVHSQAERDEGDDDFFLEEVVDKEAIGEKALGRLVWQW